MKSNLVKVALCLVLIIPSLTACSSKGQTGAIIGGLGGAALGGQLGPKDMRRQNALIGAAVGTLGGYIVGNELDKRDQAQISQALESTPSGQQTAWVNPDTRRSYTMTPQPAIVAGEDMCRDFTLVGVDQNGKQETITSRACRNAVGRWEMQ